MHSTGSTFLPGVPVALVRSAMHKAGGNEIESGKLDSPESSAALAVNGFAGSLSGLALFHRFHAWTHSVGPPFRWTSSARCASLGAAVPGFDARKLNDASVQTAMSAYLRNLSAEASQ